ncbi:MAG: hypothetical protein FD546_000144 [Pelagibacterales bacterium]|nr:hypothetical protein [Pelagibacterales bacterium]
MKKNGEIHVHCSDERCNKFFVVEVIPDAALGKRVCVCQKKLIPYDYQGEVPVIPEGHAYTAGKEKISEININWKALQNIPGWIVLALVIFLLIKFGGDGGMDGAPRFFGESR